ncbi:MAG: IGHMBP2 family helicase [Planctomycetota bacterium]
MTELPELEPFVDTMRRLIELERRAEIEESTRLLETLSAEELQRRGRCLLHLEMGGLDFGFGGRAQVELRSTKPDAPLPSHRIQTGDVVMIRPAESTSEEGPTGVVSRVRKDHLAVSLDQDLEEEFAGRLRLDKVANDVTYRRLREGLDRLKDERDPPARRLRSVLFGERPVHTPESTPISPVDEKLDASQRAAVELALGSPDFALIHGPPGTGKTTTLAELVHQAVRAGDKVLACAASNVAVDHLAEKLITRGLRVVRLGHPARLLPAILESSLDAQVERSPSQRLLRELRKDLDVTQKRLLRTRNFSERRELKTDLRHIRRGIREVEKGIVRNILVAAEVVLTTNTGAGTPHLQGFDFDRVVIDEAAQAVEVSCWIPLLLGRRAVFAGDHRQLPPTIRSREAAQGGLEVTLFERMAESFPDHCHMLEVQYRMHETIMNWASHALYDGRLVAHDSVKAHRLADLPTVDETEETATPVFFVDTAGFDAPEGTDPENIARFNEGEVKLVGKVLEQLTRAGVAPRNIGVITPYNAQVDRLRRRWNETYPALEIDTVDGFQGREKEAIVLSLVRSNDRGEVGFLAEERRLNVAITRARRHVTIIGDSATISSNPFLGGLVDYLQEHALYRSAWEMDA